MRVTAITQIWPNRIEPLAAAFNVQQFRELARLDEVEALVPLEAFPFPALIGKARMARLRAQPREQVVAGIPTVYFRRPYVPKLGPLLDVPGFLAALLPHLPRLARADVLLGTWAYPDGVATVLLARLLRKPCVIKVHGDDLHVVARQRQARQWLRRVLPHADALVSMSRGLSAELEGLGVPAGRIHQVANGVDTAVFRERGRAGARQRLGVEPDRRVAFFVGRHEPEKGIGELMCAWDRVVQDVPGAMLVLAGAGNWQARVEAWAAARPDSVRVLGEQPLPVLAQWHAASNVFTLPSWREGTPNALLEALACGRPAVASAVGGIPDVLNDPRRGLLVPPRDARALADALAVALRRDWPPAFEIASGVRSWRQSALDLHAVLESVRGRVPQAVPAGLDLQPVRVAPRQQPVASVPAGPIGASTPGEARVARSPGLARRDEPPAAGLPSPLR